MLTQEMDMDISVIRPRKLAHSQMDMDMDISNSLTRAISTHKRGGLPDILLAAMHRQGFRLQPSYPLASGLQDVSSNGDFTENP